ncbi:MAG: GTPase Era [Terriglobia bacterium]
MSHRSGVVTLLGKPNTGKSTLLNALVGTKVAIVSPHPQTTRTRLQGILTRAHAQIVFVDTPGAHRPLSRLNRQMMAAVREGLDGADLELLVVDARRPPSEEDEIAVELVRGSGRPGFLVLNKIDLIDKRALLPLIDHYRQIHPFEEFIPVSALRGDNLDVLERALIARLPEGPPLFPPDAVTDQPERFLAAEIIREKIFLETRKEVPYATAVLVETFEEFGHDNAPVAGSGAPRTLAHLQATILVEREGQKGILIGQGGQRLKRIGQAARAELEQLLGCKVYLELFAKTRADWREQAGLEQLVDWRHG